MSAAYDGLEIRLGWRFRSCARSARRRAHRPHPPIGAAAAGIASWRSSSSGLVRAPWTERLQGAWFDAPGARPRKVRHLPVTIVGSTTPACLALGQWPWPRRVLARMPRRHRSPRREPAGSGQHPDARGRMRCRPSACSAQSPVAGPVGAEAVRRNRQRCDARTLASPLPHGARGRRHVRARHAPLRCVAPMTVRGDPDGTGAGALRRRVE